MRHRQQGHNPHRQVWEPQGAPALPASACCCAERQELQELRWPAHTAHGWPAGQDACMRMAHGTRAVQAVEGVRLFCMRVQLLAWAELRPAATAHPFTSHTGGTGICNAHMHAVHQVHKAATAYYYPPSAIITCMATGLCVRGIPGGGRGAERHAARQLGAESPADQGMRAHIARRWGGRAGACLPLHGGV